MNKQKQENLAYIALLAIAMLLFLIAPALADWPPLFDIPQHFAQAGYLYHYYFLADNTFDTDLLCINTIQPYHLFHWFAAILLYLFGLQLAIYLSIATIMLAWFAASLYMLKSFKVDKWLIFPLLVFFYSTTYAWGFMPNLMALPLFPLSLALAKKVTDHQGRSTGFLLMFVLIASAFIHPVPFAASIAGSSIVLLFHIVINRQRNQQSYFALLKIAVAALIGGAYYLSLASRKAGDFTTDIITPNIFEKLLLIPDHAAGIFLYFERSIIMLLLFALIAHNILVFLKNGFNKSAQLRLLLFVVLITPYFVLPSALLTTYVLYERFLIFALLVLCLSTASIQLKAFKWIRITIVFCSILFLFLNANNHLTYASHIKGLDTILAKAEKGQKFLGVIYPSNKDNTKLHTVNHLHAYLASSTGAAYSYSFSHHRQMPVTDCNLKRQYATGELDSSPQLFTPDKHLPFTDIVLLRWPGNEKDNPFNKYVEEKLLTEVIHTDLWWLYKK